MIMRYGHLSIYLSLSLLSLSFSLSLSLSCLYSYYALLCSFTPYFYILYPVLSTYFLRYATILCIVSGDRRVAGGVAVVIAMLLVDVAEVLVVLLALIAVSLVAWQW